MQQKEGAGAFSRNFSFLVSFPPDMPNSDGCSLRDFPSNLPSLGSRIMVTIVQANGNALSLPAKLIMSTSSAMLASPQGEESHGAKAFRHDAHVGHVLVVRRTEKELAEVGDEELRDGFSPPMAALREQKFVDPRPVDKSAMDFVTEKVLPNKKDVQDT